MNLSITIAHTHTEANSRPSMTVLTSQCACQNRANSERSEEVSGSTDCATSPGFIASRPYGHDPPDTLGRVRQMAAVANRTGTPVWIKRKARLRLVRSAADPRFHGNVPPSTTGDRRKSRET